MPSKKTYGSFDFLKFTKIRGKLVQEIPSNRKLGLNNVSYQTDFHVMFPRISCKFHKQKIFMFVKNRRPFLVYLSKHFSFQLDGKNIVYVSYQGIFPTWNSMQYFDNEKIITDRNLILKKSNFSALPHFSQSYKIFGNAGNFGSNPKTMM